MGRGGSSSGGNGALNLWKSYGGMASDLRREINKLADRLLNMAWAYRKFQPVPKKGVTLRFPYMLPKPFGNGYRKELREVESKPNLIYLTNGITNVSGRGSYGRRRRLEGIFGTFSRR